MGTRLTGLGLLIFTGLLSWGGYSLSGDLAEIYRTNPGLNGLILGVFGFGILHSFYRFAQIHLSASALEERPMDSENLPRLLSPLSFLTGDQSSSREHERALDGVMLKGQESQNLSKYILGVLIFLGLIGTFWGLSLTISSISGVIQSLSISSVESKSVMEALKTGLQSPLDGMALAFSSSLFGISCSLILGVYELFIGSLWRRFFYHLEQTLSSLQEEATTPSAQELSGKGKGVISGAYLQSLVGQTFESIEGVTNLLAKSEHARQDLNKTMMSLTEKLTKLTDQREMEKSLLIKVAEGQVEFQNHLRKFGDKITEGEFGLDAGTRNHIRNLDAALNRLITTSDQGQQMLSQDLRNEIRILTKTISNLQIESPSNTDMNSDKSTEKRVTNLKVK